LRAGLCNGLATRTSFEFLQGFALALRFLARGDSGGFGSRGLQLQQRLAGDDFLAFAHTDFDDALGRGCRQRDPVVFERAQCLRRRLIAAA
jgi:hypothetical protein